MGQISKILFICMVVFILGACGNNEYSPKPKGYFRIELPSREYTELDTDCPYTFVYNKNARWEPKEDCWGDIYYPGIRARLQFTYKDVEKSGLDTLLDQGQRMAFEHIVKADGIEEKVYINKDKEVYGVLYQMEGDVATSTQFYVTDSVRHYLRGVLYFYAIPNADSLAPVNDFMQEETIRLMESIEWE